MNSLGQHLLKRLESFGVRHIFGVPGDYVLPFDKAIEESSIPFINAANELTAGYMADAYGRLSGMGVACITYGVGISIVSALAQAYVESSPLVVISGAPSAKDLEKCPHLHHVIHNGSEKPKIDTQANLFRQVTIDQAILSDPKSAPAEIERVLARCFAEKKPVYIEIPKNLVNMDVLQAPPFKVTLPCDEEALEEAVHEACARLSQAKKPLLWLGHELLRFGLSDKVLKFAHANHIPIVTSLTGKSVISERDPLFVGVYLGKMSRPEVHAFVEESDLIFLFGVMINEIDTGIFTASLEKKKLLSAKETSVQISSHVYKEVPLSKFVERFTKTAHPPFSKRSIPKMPSVAFTPKKDTPMKTERLFEGLSSYLSKDHLIIAEIGDCLFGSLDLIVEQNHYLSCAHFAALGFAVPGAVGASLGNPKARVIALVGDGGFQMTCQELSSAIRLGLDPIIIVFNNHGYGTERPLLEGTYNDIQNWSYHLLPKVFGGEAGFYVKTEEDFKKALDQAFSTRNKLHIIEVELGKTDLSRPLKQLSLITNKRAPN